MPSDRLNSLYIPDVYDSRDKTYRYMGDQVVKAYVNLWEEHREWLSPVYHQYQTSSCTANATAAAVRYLAWKTGGLSLVRQPSRLFIYYNGRAINAMDDQVSGRKSWPAGVADSGIYIRNAFKTINLFGIAHENFCPWDRQNGLPQDSARTYDKIVGLNDRPKDEAYVDAAKTHAVEYCRLDPITPWSVDSSMGPEERRSYGIITLSKLKQCLTEGYPVVFGFYFYSPPGVPGVEDFDPANPKDLPHLRYPTLKEIPEDRVHKGPAGQYGSHTVVAVGYESYPLKAGDSEVLEGLQGRVLCQNSWGSESPEAHFWLPYSYIIDWHGTSDFWMARLLSNRPPAPATDRLDVSPVAEMKLSKNWSIGHDLLTAANSNGVARKNTTMAMGDYSTIAVTSHHPSTVSTTGTLWHIWWLTNDGALESFYHTPTGWVRFQTVAAGAGCKSGLVACNRRMERNEVAWIGPEGTIETVFLDKRPNLSWYRCTLPKTSKSSVGGSLAVCSRGMDHMGIFWVTPDGGIQGASKSEFEEGPDRWKNLDIMPAGSALTKSSIAAASLGSNHQEIFWIRATATGFAVWGKRWNSTTGWEKEYQLSRDMAVARQSRLAVATRYEKWIDVYYVSPNGSVQHHTWDGLNWVQSERAPASSARVDSDIKALDATSETTTDVVWVGPDNSLRYARSDWGPKTDYAVTSSGVCMAGTPLGLFYERTHRGSFAVMFKDYEGSIQFAKFGTPWK